MISLIALTALALKSLAMAAFVLVLLRLVRGRSAAERSWVAHAGLLVLVLLPAGITFAPAWNPLPEQTFAAPADSAAMAPQILPAPPAVTPDPLDASPAAQAGWPSLAGLALLLYALPAGLLLAQTIVALLRLSALHRRAAVVVDHRWLAALAEASSRMGMRHGVALLVSDELSSPVSWGMMRPTILINSGLINPGLLNPGLPDAGNGAEAREAEAVIAHELAHIARCDWAKLLLARSVCALFWCNPLMWLLVRESHQGREEAADDAVLRSDIADTDYAALLVQAARHDNKSLLLAAHGVAPGRHSLRRRVTRVLDAGLPRRPAGTGWVLACLTLMLGLAAPVAALDPFAAPRREAVTRPADHAAAPARSPGLARRLAAPAETTTVAAETPPPAPPSPPLPDAATTAGETAPQAPLAAPDYADAMRRAGFTEAGDHAFSGARIIGVTPEFAAGMRRVQPDIALDEVVRARAIGLSPAYLGEVRSVLPDICLDDVLGLRAVGASADYIRDMRRLFSGLSVDQVQELRAIGVTPEFVREMRHGGAALKTPAEAIESQLFRGHRLRERAEGLRARAMASRGAIAISRDDRAIAD